MPIGAIGPRSKGVKWATLGSGGQRSRLYEAENRFEGLVEASFSTPLGRVGFLVLTVKYPLLMKLSRHYSYRRYYAV